MTSPRRRGPGRPAGPGWRLLTGSRVVAVHDAVAILLALANALLLECGLGRCGVEDVPELLAKRVGLKHRRVPLSACSCDRTAGHPARSGQPRLGRRR